MDAADIVIMIVPRMLFAIAGIGLVILLFQLIREFTTWRHSRWFGRREKEVDRTDRRPTGRDKRRRVTQSDFADLKGFVEQETKKSAELWRTLRADLKKVETDLATLRGDLRDHGRLNAWTAHADATIKRRTPAAAIAKPSMRIVMRLSTCCLSAQSSWPP